MLNRKTTTPNFLDCWLWLLYTFFSAVWVERSETRDKCLLSSERNKERNVEMST